MMKQMAFTIKHEIRGRMRIHLSAGRMTIRQADLFSFYLSSLPQVKEAKVYERTGDAVIVYAGERSELIRQILQFRFDDEALKELVPKNSGRAINQEYEEKLVEKVLIKLFTKVFLLAPIRAVHTFFSAIPFLWKGIKTAVRGKLAVEVLDAAAIGISMFRKDFATASSVSFLLGIGEILEE